MFYSCITILFFLDDAKLEISYTYRDTKLENDAELESVVQREHGEVHVLCKATEGCATPTNMLWSERGSSDKTA